MTMDRKLIALLLILILAGVSMIFIYTYQSQKTELTILHAGSLAVPFKSLSEIFMRENPDVHVNLEGYGSVTAARLIVEGNRTADILAVADYEVITNYLFPENLSDWYIIFARNEMVIAFTENSKYADEINANNWYEILNRSDVTYGHSDPDQDPCGYRALLVWKLSDIYYGKNIYESLFINSSRRIIRPKSVELLALLESGELDYAFEYKSVAVQHNLSYIELPPEINLGYWDKAEYYSQVNITLSDGTLIIGKPILYGVTIPKKAPHPDIAVLFLQLLLSKTGHQVFESSGQPPIYPALANDVNKVPEALRGNVTHYSP
ncbi:MAG: tungstate ABC transporter substrate-binding protein WtpA [Candidatus Asgardarchaeia archaeon]